MFHGLQGKAILSLAWCLEKMTKRHQPPAIWWESGSCTVCLPPLSTMSVVTHQGWGCPAVPPHI